MKRPANKKRWFSILFPLLLITGNLAALAESPPDTFVLVLGVSIGLTLCALGLWFVLWRLGRKRKLLTPALHAAREAGSTAYLYMVDNDVGLVTMDAHRELKLYVAEKGKVLLQTTAPANNYTLDISPYAINATMVVDGLHLWAYDERAMDEDRFEDMTIADVTMLIIADTGIEDEKVFRERANQALIGASSANSGASSAT